VDALAERVEQVALDSAFHTRADERWANIRHRKNSGLD